MSICTTVFTITPVASIESRLFNVLLRIIRKKRLLSLQFAFGTFDFYKCPEPPKEVLKNCHVDKYELHGRHVFTLSPRRNKLKKHILYLHGGAYVQNFVKQHWIFLASLVERAHCTITAPDYPLAPQHTYKDSFTMVVPLYRQLLAMAGAQDFILMGDSSGGGFALALAQKMHNIKIQQPSQIILLSPWLDATLGDPAIGEIDRRDPFLGVDGLRQAAKAYAGDTDLHNYLLSPIHGPLEGLGAISLFTGTRDLLLADARKLRSILASKNIPMRYFEYPEMIHAWMLLNFPESKKAKREIVRLITEALPPS